MLVGIFKSLRPRQWTKNLLVFAALIFSLHAKETDLLIQVGLGFLVFCLLAGSIYLLNDVADREKDRLHPQKKFRPLASGQISPAQGRISAALLLGVSLAAAWWLGLAFLKVALAYLFLNVAYSQWLRRIVLLDVLAIASGFVLRAIAGGALLEGAGTKVDISPWLLMCTFFLSLFLALGKRRHELITVGKDHRASLSGYNIALVDQLTTMTISVTVLSYAIYTIWPDTVEHFGSHDLLYTVPFVLYGLWRYLWLIQQKSEGGDPSELLLHDRGILFTVLAWLLVVLQVIYRGGALA